jgi:hypothetical protein
MYWFLTICGALATGDSVPHRKQFFCTCEAGLIKLQHIQTHKCHPLATAESCSLHGRVLRSPQSQKKKIKSSFNELLLFFWWGGGDMIAQGNRNYYYHGMNSGFLNHSDNVGMLKMLNFCIMCNRAAD